MLYCTLYHWYRYGGRVVAMIVEECHVVRQWKHDFREDYDKLSELRATVPVPWGFFSATLAMAELQADLGIRQPLLIKGLFTRTTSSWTFSFSKQTTSKQ